MIAALEAGSTAEQIALLFGPEARSRADDSRGRGRAMWSSTAPVDDVLPPSSQYAAGWLSAYVGKDLAGVKQLAAEQAAAGAPDFLTAMLAGATPELPIVLRKMAEHPTAVRFAVPLYVLNYIWDGNELTPKQMRDEEHETACYSIHAVGLVFDLPSKTVSLADPNGCGFPLGFPSAFHRFLT